MDRNRLILCKEKLADIEKKMEEYIINEEDCEPLPMSIMYIQVRDVLDIIRETLKEDYKNAEF